MKLRQQRPAFWALFLLAAATAVLALQVAPGSPCAHKCLGSGADNNWSADASNTNSSEITCSDAAYSDSQVGLKYKQCLECLRTSSRGNWGETDAKWFVYNLRFALDVCLYDSPEADPAVHSSPCASNEGCKNLKSALTGDDLAPTQNMTWDYCFRDDGAFMSSNRTTCMQCLRDTQDQTYMANCKTALSSIPQNLALAKTSITAVLTALEAGCRQTPEKGTAIGLSGSVFSSAPVNITDPDTPPHEDHDSLSTGAIIGIAVSVIIVILVAIALLLFYCHKEKTQESWEDYYYDAYAPQAARPRRAPSRAAAVQRPVQYLPTQPKPMGEVPRAMFIRSNNTKYPEEKPKTFASSGDYYDSIEQGLRSNNGESYPMKELHPAAAHSTGTLHSKYSACSDRSISRGRSRAAARDGSPPSPTASALRRELSPPASVHKRVRSNTPDSFAVQAYMDAAAESARMAAVAAAAASPPTESSTASHGSTKRRSMLSLLSLPKLGSGGHGGGKKDKESPPLHPRYILQPRLTNDKAFHGDKNISRPILAREEPRFLDASTMSSNAPVISRLPRPPTPPDQYSEYKEVPLKSGALWN
ncbi:hypothetical protein LLEC1_02141 [Akanthomyces lecanii]|uniref:LPXTG-domain-containing protein n=1 Tax=Cordyceps confragosa TaxID=2714763 RepID=A0A179IG30_CORDF|nr:hypothetical protein LLEC1_02141 [Akanthomyces lecanii]